MELEEFHFLGDGRRRMERGNKASQKNGIRHILCILQVIDFNGWK
jgi:hypothetical protein